MVVETGCPCVGKIFNYQHCTHGAVNWDLTIKLLLNNTTYCVHEEWRKRKHIIFTSPPGNVHLFISIPCKNIVTTLHGDCTHVGHNNNIYTIMIMPQLKWQSEFNIFLYHCGHIHAAVNQQVYVDLVWYRQYSVDRVNAGSCASGRGPNIVLPIGLRLYILQS